MKSNLTQFPKSHPLFIIYDIHINSIKFRFISTCYSLTEKKFNFISLQNNRPIHF